MQIRIGTYEKLREYVKVFNEGHLDILIIEGSAGAGKSSIVKEHYRTLPENQFCWLEGRTTAAAFYMRLHEFRDLPIIVDDVDGLYKDKECVNLLKCLCQTEKEKRVMWNTMTRLRDSHVPPEFKTKSKVCIITNSWKALNKHVGAVEDRGLLIKFHPPAEEVHRYVKDELGNNPEIFDDEVYNFIGQHLGIIAEPSIRHYYNSLKLKRAEMDWREVLIESFGLSDNEMAVLKLMQEDALSNRQRSTIFAEKYKKSERTFFRVKAELQAKGVPLGGSDD